MSRLMSSRWAGKIFCWASAGENHCARSTSGKDALRPLFGGHSSSKRLETSVGLLLEFTLCHCQRLFAFRILAFRDRPGAVVLLSPKWTARMHEQNLDLDAEPPEHQQAGAALGHRTFSLPLRESARLTAGCYARSPASPQIFSRDKIVNLKIKKEGTHPL